VTIILPFNPSAKLFFHPKHIIKNFHSYDILGAGMLWKPKDLHKIR
jgi:hypothetical protein